MPAPYPLECYQRTYHPNQCHSVDQPPEEARAYFSGGSRPVLDEELLSEAELQGRQEAIRRATGTHGAIESYVRQVTDALHAPRYLTRTRANIRRLFRSRRVNDHEIASLINHLNRNEMTAFYLGVKTLFGGQALFYFEHTPAEGVLMCFPALGENP